MRDEDRDKDSLEFVFLSLPFSLSRMRTGKKLRTRTFCLHPDLGRFFAFPPYPSPYPVCALGFFLGRGPKRDSDFLNIFVCLLVSFFVLLFFCSCFYFSIVFRFMLFCVLLFLFVVLHCLVFPVRFIFSLRFEVCVLFFVFRICVCFAFVVYFVLLFV